MNGKIHFPRLFSQHRMKIFDWILLCGFMLNTYRLRLSFVLIEILLTELCNTINCKNSFCGLLFPLDADFGLLICDLPLDSYRSSLISSVVDLLFTVFFPLIHLLNLVWSIFNRRGINFEFLKDRWYKQTFFQNHENNNQSPVYIDKMNNFDRADFNFSFNF
jgi:hypothetical protein